MKDGQKNKRVLIISSCPLANDGLTKIEMDVIHTFIKEIDFEFACCFGFDNTIGQELKKNGIKCHNLPLKKNVYSYMSSIKRLVHRRKYEVVYIHGNSAMMFLESIPSRNAGAKVVTHCHNTKSNFPIVHYLAKPIFNMSVDRKIGCSSLASKWAYFGKRIYTIPNGVDVQRFSYNEPVRNRIKAELGWSENKIIGHIGRFNRQKNHKKIIGIFHEILKKDNSCRLLLIGDGELRSEVMADIENRHIENYVRIINYTDKPQDYMQAMDIMLMPSLFEGLCLVVLEAQANGLPVLVNKNFAPETFVTDQAFSLKLSLSDLSWADYSLDLMKRGRKNVTKQIYEKKMDYDSMMKSIYKVLVN